MPNVEALSDQAAHPAGILVESWPNGQKKAVTASASRSDPFPAGTGAVRVTNRTNQTIWVRADDGTAADDGKSDVLDPSTSMIYAIQSADGTIGLLGVAGNAGSVYMMPVKGRR